MPEKMIIGVPKETARLESRVGLNPFDMADLTKRGHTVLVERGAGSAAHFGDVDYQEAGGHIVYTTDELYGRADLLCRVGRISDSELALLSPGMTICGF
jgi:alanine dehydrogenase